jgi:hypothetical protein
VAGFYRDRRILAEVDGMGEIVKIADRIDQALAAAQGAGAAKERA